MYCCDAVDSGGNSSCKTWFAEQFVVCSVTQFIKVLEVLRTVTQMPGAVNHRVDALSIGRFGEPMPCTGGVRQSGDDGGAVDVL